MTNVELALMPTFVGNILVKPQIMTKFELHFIACFWAYSPKMCLKLPFNTVLNEK